MHQKPPRTDTGYLSTLLIHLRNKHRAHIKTPRLCAGVLQL